MSAVIQEKPIETIYDHGVTADEILQMTKGYPETKEEYFEVISKDSSFADLYRLYAIRGDAEKAFSFLEKVEDIGFKNQFKMRPCCAVHS